MQRSVEMHSLTESKSLSDKSAKEHARAKKRIMLDVQAPREAYKSREISNTDWLMKRKMEKAFFELLQTIKHTINCEQWT